MRDSPLVRHCFPPFLESSPSTHPDDTPFLSLVDRLHLPDSDPQALNLSLLLVICALARRHEKRARVWAMEAGKQVVYARLTSGVSEGAEGENEARKRERRAIDAAQTVILLVVFFHMTAGTEVCSPPPVLNTLV